MKYTVKAGDTLSKIGQDLGVDWRQIASVNGISSPYTIYVGDQLTIPTGSNTNPSESDGAVDIDYSNSGIVDKVIAGGLLYGLFQILKKVF